MDGYMLMNKSPTRLCLAKKKKKKKKKKNRALFFGLHKLNALYNILNRNWEKYQR